MPKIVAAIAFAVFGIFSVPVLSQDAGTTPPSPPKPKEKSFADATKDCKKIEGLFTLYWNADDLKLFIAIKPEQFSRDYLLNLTRQSGDAQFFDAGAMLNNYAFGVQKIGKKVQFVLKNVSFRADSSMPIARALKQNLSNSIMASAPFASEPEPETGVILIDAAPVFLQDFFNVVFSMQGAKKTFAFDKNDSYFTLAQSFPLNTELTAALHFKSQKPEGANTLPDSRSMTHRYHFSISEFPNTGYTPRMSDDRVGYFTTTFQDYSSLLADTPYIRYINRWHLEKSDSSAALSTPKNPIVYWLENTVPMEFREWIAEGVLMWNPAFERIGFKDAIQVKQMPDTAEWDPADVRYNTIRWIIQPGGGYAVGPSNADPFTGQIYDADIRISADFIRSMHRSYDFSIDPGISHRELCSGEGLSHNTCNYADGGREEFAFGQDALSIRNDLATDEMKRRYIREYVVSLVAHEVGHTLGLRHNFKASALHTTSELKDSLLTKRTGVSGSVMDYLPVNISPKGLPQGQFYHTELGPYDYWAIEYGYKPFSTTAGFSDENSMLKSIASKSTQPELRYGTDEDAMGNSVRSLDPLCNLFDNGSDLLEYYEQRIAIAKDILASLPQKGERNGDNFERVRSIFSRAISQYAGGAGIAAKFVGGIYTNRNHIGDPQYVPPFTPVSSVEQRKALEFLKKHYFTPDAFAFSPELLNKLAVSRSDDFEGSTWNSRQDYPLHSTIRGVMSAPLYRLLDPTVLSRVQDNELRYDKSDLKPFSQNELFGFLTSAIWGKEQYADNNFQRELQREYVGLLAKISLKKDPQYNRDAISFARAELESILQTCKRTGKGKKSAVAKAHYDDISAKIAAALSASAERSDL